MPRDQVPVTVRNPRREAEEVLGAGYVPGLLEPSPPAVDDGQWFADDPATGQGGSGRFVSPAYGPELSWDEWLTDHADRSTWAAARWLGARPRLEPPPASLGVTRVALHRVAVYAVSPARRRVNGKIGLRWTLDGFGTPFFGADEQVRVEGDHLVRQSGERAWSAPITTLAAAAELALAGAPDIAWAAGFDVPPPGDLEADLGVDPEAASFLGQWFGFSWSVLEQLRADPRFAPAGRVQLWPEHFDAAADCLPEDGGRRATFGASPGDAVVDEPYLYALPADFARVGESAVWNATSFPGAILRLGELLDASDQREAALGFFRRVRDVVVAE